MKLESWKLGDLMVWHDIFLETFILRMKSVLFFLYDPSDKAPSSTSTKPKRWWENFQDHLSWHRVSDANRLYFTKIPMMCRNPRCCHFRPNEVPRRSEALLNSDRWAVHFPVNLGVATEKGWARWNDPVGVHGVSPYTSANRSFKEAVPKNSLLTYHFVGCPGSFIIGPMFIPGGILLKSFGTSLGQRPGPFIVDSNHSALGFGPPARSLCVGWHTWHQLPDGYQWAVEGGWVGWSWCEISEIPQGTYFCWDPRNKFLSWKRRWSKVVSTRGTFQSPGIVLISLKNQSCFKASG